MHKGKAQEAQVLVPQSPVVTEPAAVSKGEPDLDSLLDGWGEEMRQGPTSAESLLDELDALMVRRSSAAPPAANSTAAPAEEEDDSLDAALDAGDVSTNCQPRANGWRTSRQSRLPSRQNGNRIWSWSDRRRKRQRRNKRKKRRSCAYSGLRKSKEPVANRSPRRPLHLQSRPQVQPPYPAS
jgi:hypothetical protein